MPGGGLAKQLLGGLRGTISRCNQISNSLSYWQNNCSPSREAKHGRRPSRCSGSVWFVAVNCRKRPSAARSKDRIFWYRAMLVVGADFSIRIVWFAYKFSSLKFVGQYHHPLESLIPCDRLQPRPHPPIDFVSKISGLIARECPTIPLINQRFICLNNVVSVHAIP